MSIIGEISRALDYDVAECLLSQGVPLKDVYAFAADNSPQSYKLTETYESALKRTEVA